MGKRDGLFFLWGEIERARLQARNGSVSESAASNGAEPKVANGTGGKPILAVDEFIFR